MDQPGGHYAYKAFITYSHRDTAWAKWLLDALEVYRLPVDLREHLGRRRGVGRIFRDRDEAGAASDLKDEIQTALFSSEHLIIVASPNSARSKYVESEIQTFADHNAMREVPGRILALIVEGEPNVSPLEGKMAMAECFPLSLRGGLRKPDGTPVEPLAADARHTGDGKTRALAKVVSGLLNVRYDTLVRRDLRRRRRAQVLAGIAVVVALGVAGVVAAVLISDNIKQERLRLAQQGAERSFRTVTAVNNAERARHQLATGDLANAVALAHTGLPDDGSLPFIPQAYSVLYGALFQAHEPLAVDLGSVDGPMAQTFEMTNGQFFSVDGAGKATIWSPTKGAVFTRNDLDIKPAAMSPDGSVVFVQPINSMLRYHADTGRWDKIDPTGFNTDDPNVLNNTALEPPAYIAIDANTLAGCGGPILRVISVPEGDGTASLLWTHKFDGISCDVLEATPQDTLMVSNFDDKVFEIDLKTHQFLHEYETRDTPTLWSRSVGNVVVVASIGAIYVFDRESAKPMLSFKDSGEPSLISGSGRYILEPGILSGAGGIIVHDLKMGSTARLPCQNCSVVGFSDEATALALGSDHQQILAFDTATGAPKSGGFAFPLRIDRAEIFEASKTLLGLRPPSESLVTVLGQIKSGSTLVAGQPGKFMVAAMFAGPDTIVSETADRAQSIPMRTTFHLYRAAVGGEEIVAPELNSITGVSELARLPQGLFSVFATDNIAETSGVYRIFDAGTGKLVLKKSITARPIPFGTSRYILLSVAGDFGVFDLKSRDFNLISAGTGAGLGVAWSANRNYLATAVGTTVRLFSLGEDGAKLKVTLMAGEPPVNICVTLNGTYIYMLDYSADPPILHRVSVSSGKEDARIVMDYGSDRDLSRVLLDTIDVGDEKVPSLVCDDSRAVIRDEVAHLAVAWVPADKIQKMLTMPLAKFDSPALPDGEGSNESLLPDQLGLAVFTYSDERLSLRDPVTQKPLVTITPEASRIASATWVPSRGLVAAGLDNGRLQVWDATSASAKMIDLAAHGEPLDKLDASPDGKWLLTGDSGGTLKLWPLFTSAELLKASEGEGQGESLKR